MCSQVGHETTNERPTEPRVEGLGQWGGFHHDGVHLSHTHGAASSNGAKSQVQKNVWEALFFGWNHWKQRLKEIYC